jgi:transposase
VSELKARLNQNSQNSSKPPSSDGLGKPPVKSLREKAGRKPGGQHGHSGHGLKIDREPDEVVVVEPITCDRCGADLEEAVKYQTDTRYIYDVEIKVTLTRYEIMEAICPNCGATVTGTPPFGSKGSKGYGNLLRTLCIILTQYGYMGIDKTHKVLHDLLGIPISTGTIKSIQQEFSEKSKPTLETIKANLLQSPTLNTDETGGRVSGRTQWFHVASNAKYTLVSVHQKRGREGTEAAGVVQHYTGRLIHDCWSAYFGFDKCKHALCCAHLLRELNALIERGQKWATEMKQLLLEMKKVVDSYKDNDKTELSRYYHNKFKARYNAVIEKAKAEIVPSTTRKKSKEENLLKRLNEYREEVTAFTSDFNVSFDNNQAERDIRNIKVKGKVSGGFRSQSGAEDYANTASVFGTVAKLGKSVVSAVKGLFDGANLQLDFRTE